MSIRSGPRLAAWVAAMQRLTIRAVKRVIEIIGRLM
jgi:hypothetical protein